MRRRVSREFVAMTSALVSMAAPSSSGLEEKGKWWGLIAQFTVSLERLVIGARRWAQVIGALIDTVERGRSNIPRTQSRTAPTMVLEMAVIGSRSLPRLAALRRWLMIVPLVAQSLLALEIEAALGKTKSPV
jgi:hypothetical protein